MCGINGFFGFEDKNLLKRMNDAIKHRGPDQFGQFSDKDISLAHRRLSIIDLSEKGRQPMSNEDESIFIVFNGEIYNFKELREKLEKKGHIFRSNTDTEVIVHAYEEYGERCLSYFDGMFAFAIWDSENRLLFIARDRVGIKPLYYFIDKEPKTGRIKFVFSSEIKSILECDFIARELNRHKVAEYLTYRFVPGEETLFKGIYLLPQSNYMIIKDSQFKKVSYWNPFEGEFSKDKKIGLSSASKRFIDLLKSSVSQRLIADVPLGVYLSGGIDSTTILAMMSELGKKDIETFTVGFGGDTKADELKKARIASEHFSTRHNEIIIEPRHIRHLPAIIWHLDQPIGDMIITANYFLSKLAQTKVKVVLSGEGADETLAGYVQYRNLKKAETVRRLTTKTIRNRMLPAIIDIMPIKAIDKLYDYPESIGEKGKNRLINLIKDIDDEVLSYLNHISLYSPQELRKVLRSEPENHEISHIYDDVQKRFNKIKNCSIIRKIAETEYAGWLPENILFRLDKMTMAHSIEGRVPFLDHRLVQFAINLPDRFKLEQNTEKFLLRYSMKRYLPKEFTQRKKQAFFIPARTEYHKELYDICKSVLDESEIKKKGIFEYDEIRKIIDNKTRSRFLSEKQITSLLNFELWYRIFINGENQRKIF